MEKNYMTKQQSHCATCACGQTTGNNRLSRQPSEDLGLKTAGNRLASYGGLDQQLGGYDAGLEGLQGRRGSQPLYVALQEQGDDGLLGYILTPHETKEGTIYEASPVMMGRSGYNSRPSRSEGQSESARKAKMN